MEIAIAIFIGIWFTVAGAVATFAVFKDYKKSGEDK